MIPMRPVPWEAPRQAPWDHVPSFRSLTRLATSLEKSNGGAGRTPVSDPNDLPTRLLMGPPMGVDKVHGMCLMATRMHPMGHSMGLDGKSDGPRGESHGR